MDNLKKQIPKIITVAIVVAALFFGWSLLRRYQSRPWTRDGQVRADIIKVAPRVEGYIDEVAVKDNEFVKKGTKLFRIYRRPFELAVETAQVDLDQAREDVAALEAAVQSAEAIVQQRNAAVTSAQSKIDEARAGVDSADAAIQEADSGVVSARAMIAQVEAQLEEARREAARAKRLADATAGSVETAEAKAAAVKAIQAQLDSAKAGVKQAQAALDKAKSTRRQAQAQLVAAQNGLAESQAAVASAVADRDRARANLGEPGEANVRIRSAIVALEEAKLKLDWTTIYAPSDGYVSNLYVREGTYAVTRSPLVAFVDSNSFRVHAYFKETQLKHIKPGDRAVVTLMNHHNQPIEGVVDTIGNATNPPGVASTEGELGVVPQIEPTFDWVRLAQRVPVTIRLENVPEDLKLVSGTTASIAVKPRRN